jgi:hypothetical protein
LITISKIIKDARIHKQVKDKRSNMQSKGIEKLIIVM